MNTNKPVHVHDCEHCIYLGTFFDAVIHEEPGTLKKEAIDCYWCRRGKEKCPNLCSVLGRFGSEGQEYLSSHPFEAFAEGDSYLSKAQGWYLYALLQAVRMGLYTPAPPNKN
jgi:hypothetical protein